MQSFVPYSGGITISFTNTHEVSCFSEHNRSKQEPEFFMCVSTLNSPIFLLHLSSICFLLYLKIELDHVKIISRSNMWVFDVQISHTMLKTQEAQKMRGLQFFSWLVGTIKKRDDLVFESI